MDSFASASALLVTADESEHEDELEVEAQFSEVLYGLLGD